MTLDDIKRFRQLDSKCPGHPEYRWTSGVETTTGPLGQGLAMSVGIAIAKRWLASYFNRAGFELFDYAHADGATFLILEMSGLLGRVVFVSPQHFRLA